MNYLQAAKNIVDMVGFSIVEDTPQALYLANTYAMIAIAEAITQKTNVNIEDRIKLLDDFRYHAEESLENIENRNPHLCPTCSQPQRYTFPNGWACLNIACPDSIDDIPF